MKTKTHLFGEIPAIIKLALPIVVSLSASTLIGVVDTIMIAPLGTQSLGAASITTAVIIIFYSGLYGIASICGVLSAQSYGAGHHGDIAPIFKSSLIVSLISGSIGAVLMGLMYFTLPLIGQPAEVIEVIGPYWIAMSLLLIPYTVLFSQKSVLEGIDLAWVGVVFAFSAVAINIPANYLLIHGVGEWDGLGLLGAGLASLLSETCAVILILSYWAMTPKRLHSDQMQKLKSKILKTLLKTVCPFPLDISGKAVPLPWPVL